MDNINIILKWILVQTCSRWICEKLSKCYKLYVSVWGSNWSCNLSFIISCSWSLPFLCWVVSCLVRLFIWCFIYLPLLTLDESERTSFRSSSVLVVINDVSVAEAWGLLTLPEATFLHEGLQMQHTSLLFPILDFHSQQGIYLIIIAICKFVFPDLQLCVIQSSTCSLSHQVSHKWRTDSSHCPSTTSAWWWGCDSPITLCSWIQRWDHQDIWPGKSGNDHEDAASRCFSYCNIILSSR